MNEHEPTAEFGGRHAELAVSVEQLSVKGSDPNVLAVWEEGLSRWGEAFAAYTTLGTLKLHTIDVLADFESIYAGSFESFEEFAEEQIESNGWNDALEVFRHQQGITADLLDWNHVALVQHLRLVYDFMEWGGTIHVFAK